MSLKQQWIEFVGHIHTAFAPGIKVVTITDGHDRWVKSQEYTDASIVTAVAALRKDFGVPPDRLGITAVTFDENNERSSEYVIDFPVARTETSSS
jgi:hypothetical protein